MSVTAGLTAEKALIFRITHRDNIPWILDHGLHCKNSNVQDPGFVAIGSTEIIDRRTRRTVTQPPGGMLADCVPFYFTPLSPMLYNIKTGQGGVTKRPMDEIVILVSSLYKVIEHKLQFLFTDRHAIYATVNFFSDLNDLSRISWDLLQARDFKKDPDDPGKVERYQAETLVFQHVPFDALLGFVCYNKDIKAEIDAKLTNRGQEGEVKVYDGWFF